MDQCVTEAFAELVEASKKYQNGQFTLDEMESANENFEDVMLIHASPPKEEDPF